MTNTERRRFLNFTVLRYVLYLAIAVPLIHSPSTVAAPINAQQAALVANNYAAKHPSAGKLPARTNAALPKGAQVLTKKDKSIAFVVPLEAAGFVLVRSDDDLPPVKLQVTSGTYEELPPNFRHIIETELAGEMEALDALRKTGQSPDKRYNLLWRTYSTSPATNAADSPISQPASANTWLTTTAWGQGSPYNCYTPSVPGGNAIAGCNAIALAQLIRYHSKPIAPLTDYSYSDTSGSCQGVHHMSDGCGVGDYDWANMPNTVSAASPLAQQQAIGKLVYHCGVAMGSDYEASSTGAYPSYAPVALTTNSVLSLVWRA